MSLIDNLEWRYAVKQFEPTIRLSDSQIEPLKRAIQLTSSSYGLQPYKVLIVENPEIRNQLLPHSWGQKQIIDASHLFVFCNFLEVSQEYIKRYISLRAEIQGLEEVSLRAYEDFMTKAVSGMSQEQVFQWTAKQTYMALDSLMVACAEAKIDACPMEGFSAQEYNKILNLTDKGLSACLVAAVGYRSSKDQTQHAKKVRKNLDDLFETIK